MHLSSKFQSRPSLFAPFLLCIPYFFTSNILRFGVQFVLDDIINRNLVNTFFDFFDGFLIAYSFWEVASSAIDNIFGDMFNSFGIPPSRTRVMSICLIIVLLYAQLYGYAALVAAFGNFVGVVIMLTKITAVSIMYYLLERLICMD